MAHYFTKDTDASIKSFLESTSELEKHAIFDTGIRPAFEKLIESQIFTYGFYSIDDPETLKRECLTNLYEMLPKFDPNRGTKGFSYFNVICKNWFIQKTREKLKRNKVESELFYDLDHEIVRRDPSFTAHPHEDMVEEQEFWVSLFTQLKFWKKKLTKESEIKILDAIIFLLENPDMVPIYNKKAVYVYLRDLTGLTTKQVVMNLKRIKLMYASWKDGYLESGEIET
jgi:predicted nuclease of restriction endonuclease-like RecB superfamily